MPIYRSEDIDKAPDWIDVSSFGVARLSKGDTLEPHYHDCDEFWYIVSGVARVRTEGSEFTVRSGDVVCTQMGDWHEIIEIVEEELVAVWIENGLRGEKRTGHLHE